MNQSTLVFRRKLLELFQRFRPAGMMLSARVRALLFATVHLLLFAAVYRLAFELRFDFKIPDEPYTRFQASLPWVLLLKTLAFHLSGCFHGSWWYVTFADLRALLQATIIGFIAVVTVDHFVLEYQIPRAVIILDAMLGIMVVGAFRAGWRLMREGVWTVYHGRSLRSALVIGANHECGLLAQQINAHPEVGCRVRGFLSTGNTPTGIRLGQIPVLGKLDDLQRVTDSIEASEILVPANIVSGSELRIWQEAVNGHSRVCRNRYFAG